MKELTKKILESGLVDEHVARMMERWGQLDDGASDIVGRRKVTKQTLMEFADQIEELVESQEFRQTRLDINVKHEVWVRLCEGGTPVKGYIDVMDQLILPAEACARERLTSGKYIDLAPRSPRGGVTEWSKTKILDVEPIYTGDKVAAMQFLIDGYSLVM